MPNWKKVITSGSNVHLNNINSSGEITASGNISSSGTIVANELQDTSLTAGRVAFVGTNGVLTDDSDLTFATDTLTATKIAAYSLTGKLTAGSTEIEGSNFDINGGTIDGITSLTAGGNLDIGSHTFRAHTLHADNEGLILGGLDGDGILLKNHTQTALSIGQADDDSVVYMDVSADEVSISTRLDLTGTTDATNASGDTGVLRVEGGASIAKKVFVGTNLHAGAITASGNISASGKVYANNLHVGNVNSSGIGTGGPTQILIGSAQGGPSGSIKFQSANSSVTIQQAKDVNGGALTFTKNDGTDIVLIGHTAGTAPELEVIGQISASGFVSASHFSGDGAGLTNVSATVADESITLAKLAHADANTVMVRDAGTAGDPSFKEVTNTQILIGDGSGFTAAALSGDVTMTNGGVVTIEANAVEGSMLNTNVAGTGLTVAGNNIDVDAAQTQITSVGTLTSLNVDGAITSSGIISSSGAITASGFNLIGSGTAELEVDGHITSSGNISGSSTTTASLAVLNLVGGTIDLKNQGVQSQIKMYCEDANQHFQTIKAAPHSDGASNTLTLPSVGTVFSTTDGTQTLTNKTLTSPTINNITTFTANGNLDIGAHDFRAATLTADGLTSGRVVFAGTNGVLSDDSDLTFATDTLTVTKIANVNSTSHITSSGNISASSNVICNEIVVGGGTFTSSSLAAGGSGGSGGISHDGSTADGVLTFKDSDEATVESNLTFDGTTLITAGNLSASGNFQVEQTASMHFNNFDTGSNPAGQTYSTGGEAMGDIVKFGMVDTGTMVAGKIYYLNTGGAWVLANATDNTAGADELLAVALGETPSVDGMLLRGVVRMNGAPAASNVRGRACYLHTTAGHSSTTAPSSNDNVVRVVGYLINNLKKEIWFNPSSVWVKVTA